MFDSRGGESEKKILEHVLFDLSPFSVLNNLTGVGVVQQKNVLGANVLGFFYFTTTPIKSLISVISFTVARNKLRLIFNSRLGPKFNNVKISIK